jgi:Saxitoxin biosynthesis operon protein SxtJ
MHWSDIDFQPERKKLRQFAVLWLCFFLGLAVWKGLWQGQTLVGGLLAAIAVAVGVVGSISPARIRLVFVAATVLAFPIGWVVSHLILAMLFFGVLTPVGLLFRLLGRDPLLLKRRANAESYWLAKPPAAHPRRYFHQF